jgi:hypothetical protein
MSATFWFQDYSYGPNMFTYRLLAGAGTNGPVLASTSFLIPFTPPDGFYGSATATFDSVPLTVGQQYTLLISATNIHCLVGAVDTSVPAFPNYAGGTAIISGIIQPQIDLGFVIQTVPEPNAAALLVCGAGVGILIWARKNLRPCRRAGEELRIADSRQRRPE